MGDRLLPPRSPRMLGTTRRLRRGLLPLLRRRGSLPTGALDRLVGVVRPDGARDPFSSAAHAAGFRGAAAHDAARALDLCRQALAALAIPRPRGIGLGR